MKQLLVSTVILFFVIALYSQIPGNAVNNIITPNAATYEKYGNYPVSMYSGVIDISIPFYTIDLGNNISIPISLSYNTSGIKVREESGRVGLGWTLNAGGIINQTISKYNDFKWATNYISYFNNFHQYRKPIDLFNIEQIVNNSVFPCTDVPFRKGLISPSVLKDSLHYLILPWACYDTNPDVFYYNFVGFSGKFTYLHSGEVIKDRLDNNILIRNNSTSNVVPTEWELVDGNGTIYKFGKSEKSSGKLSGATVAENNYEPVTWYLTEIITKNNRKVKFNYKTIFDTGYRFGEVFQSVNGQTVNTSGYLLKHYDAVYIDNIEFDNGKIFFIYNDPVLDKRKDLMNELKLMYIKVYNSRNELIKNIEFLYDYFQSEISGNLIVPENTLSNFYGELSQDQIIELITHRLKLTQINEYYVDTNDKKTYMFSYNEENLPAKLSTAQDHWGYFNGKTANATIIPSFTVNYGLNNAIEGIFKYEYSDREACSTYNQAFILQEVLYPTGGKSCFEYETNSYDPSYLGLDPSRIHYYYRKKEASILENATNGLRNAVLNRANFTIFNSDIVRAEGCKVTLTAEVLLPPPLTYFQTGYGLIKPTIRIINRTNSQILYEFDYSDFYSDASNPHKYSLVQYVNLYAGEYAIETSGENKELLEQFKSGVKWTSSPNTFFFENNECLGGGLRVKTLKNITNNFINVKTYNYFGGKLLNYPRYRFREAVKFGNVYISSVAFNTSSTSVGYDEVEEIVSNNSSEMAKTDKHFFNETIYFRPFYCPYHLIFLGNSYVPEYDVIPDEIYSGFSDIRNGTLISQNDYKLKDGTYFPVRNITNNYDFNIRDRVWAVNHEVKKDGYGYDNDIMTCEEYHLLANAHYYGNIYPVLDRTWTKLNSMSEKIINEDGTFIVKNIDYQYNNLNKQIKSITTTNSNGIIHKEIFDYVNMIDPNNVERKLIQQNRIEEIVGKKVEINDNDQVSKCIYSYSDMYNNFLGTPLISKKEEYLGDKVSYISEYEEYDSKGNPLSIKDSKEGRIVYLWSYKGQYPIAKIEYATYSQVEAVIQSIFSVLSINDLSELLVPDENKLINGSLQNALPNSIVSTYTFKPLVGMTSKTDPRGVTTYYEYDNFNRLKEVYIMENGVKKVLEHYSYKYKTN